MAAQRRAAVPASRRELPGARSSSTATSIARSRRRRCSTPTCRSTGGSTSSSTRFKPAPAAIGDDLPGVDADDPRQPAHELTLERHPGRTSSTASTLAMLHCYYGVESCHAPVSGGGGRHGRQPLARGGVAEPRRPPARQRGHHAAVRRRGGRRDRADRAATRASSRSCVPAGAAPRLRHPRYWPIWEAAAAPRPGGRRSPSAAAPARRRRRSNWLGSFFEEYNDGHPQRASRT